MPISVSWHTESPTQVSSLGTYPADVRHLAKVAQKSDKCLPSDGEDRQLSPDGNASVPDRGTRGAQVRATHQVCVALQGNVHCGGNCLD